MRRTNILTPTSNPNNINNKKLKIHQLGSKISSFSENFSGDLPPWATELLSIMLSMMELCKDVLSISAEQQETSVGGGQQQQILTSSN